jgi:hypothetical protein
MIASNTRHVSSLILAVLIASWSSNAAGAEQPKVPLVKLPVTFGAAMENTPFVFGGRPLLALNYRDDTKNNTDAYKASMYLLLLVSTTPRGISLPGAVCAWPCTSVPCDSSSKPVSPQELPEPS